LCCKCPNESCEPILDIYISIAFQWYNSSMRGVLTFTIALWRFGNPPRLQLPNASVSLHLHTLSHSSWPTPLQAFALVTSPRLRHWDCSYAINTFGGKSMVIQCYQAPIYYDIHKWKVNSHKILCGILGGMQCWMSVREVVNKHQFFRKWRFLISVSVLWNNPQ
jgi:hypothetical protein